MIFAYVMTTVGIKPQKWAFDLSVDQKPHPYVWKTKLSPAEELLSVEQLEQLYPLPGNLS